MGDSACTSARRKLNKLRFPPRVSPDEQYFRASDLNVFLDQQAIEAILDCRCHRCKDHLKSLNKANLVDPRKLTRPSSDYLERVCDARALFALLISIEHPMFIIPFVEKDNASRIRDYCKPTTRADDLEAIWPEYRRQDPDESFQLAENFIYTMHQFAPAEIRDEKFTFYDEKTRLPFYNQHKLGAGSYGVVYSFEICEEYIDKEKIPVCLSQALGPFDVLRTATTGCSTHTKICSEAAEE